ncbi:MAG: RsmD family RNA methyltransferase [Candidatus Nomurabacteria bacterium]|jgi:23S rRNA (uracil1939-C5)-methyltransferase|nr:RsmD family RNA methyltransferase [Candidatus Nomurabacteria bacterium]
MEKIRLIKIVPGGQTLGELSDGKKVFVWGGLPDEEVEVEIYKNKKNYAEAVATKIFTKSPFRVAEKDKIYLSTSPWQIMDFQYELQQKSKLVCKAFGEQHIEIELPEIQTDRKEYFYRNKMEYALWWDKELCQIFLALHKRGSHHKVPIETSSIERSEILMEAQKIVAQLNQQRAEARTYQSLIVRCTETGEVSSALFENGKPHEKMNLLKDKLLGHEYSYSPNGFFQINLPVYEMALLAIKQHISMEKVVDMYSGVGTIGLSVAGNKNLTLVETDKMAYAEMRKNASDFDNKNIRTIHAKSEEALDYITSDICLILDPPRAGLHEKVVAKILEKSPPKIIYLSCNPITQARDVKFLLQRYKIAHMTTFNFFPKTPHIENLTVLEVK